MLTNIMQNFYRVDNKKRNVNDCPRSHYFGDKIHLANNTGARAATVTITSQTIETRQINHDSKVRNVEESSGDDPRTSPVLRSRSRRNKVIELPSDCKSCKHSNSVQLHVEWKNYEFGNSNGKVRQTSPVLKSQRSCKSLSRSVIAASPPWKKLQVDKCQPPEGVVTLSCKEVTRVAPPESPSTSFMNLDDSLLENVDFEKIDTICASVESTPKRKISRTKMTPLSGKITGPLGFNLRKTVKTIDVRKKVVNKEENQMNVDNKHGGRRGYNYGVSKSLIKTFSSEDSVCPESTSSSNNSSTAINTLASNSSSASSTEPKELATNPPIFSGRASPDIFDDDVLGSSNGRLSDSFDAELCLIEEGYIEKCSNEVSKSETKCSVVAGSKDSPVRAAHHEGSQYKSQESELSFSSTLESQPLIGRFQDKLKKLATLQPSGPAAAPLKSEHERRAEAVAAALEEAARTRILGEDFELGPFFGLPSKVAEVLKIHRGISELYDWQKECINEGSGSKNLLISLPTSGGKTLVAEVLMLRELLLKQRDAVFILPYVSLVQEKVRGLSPFGVELGFLVEEYAASKGTFPPKPRRKKRVIYVATIEKASGLVNALLETRRIEELGLVVVDEVHMLGENGGRGATLEGVLTKMRYAAPKVRLVAMSATVGNLKELAHYLDAKLYTGSFRPVQLTEYVKIGEQVWEVNSAARVDEDLLKNQRLCCFPYSSSEQKRLDADMIGGLVGEVVPNHSCLVFCPTRRNCETLAELICRILPRGLIQIKHVNKVSLYRALVEEGGGSVCSVLRKTLPYGIAYHHSGLTDGERRLIEEGYITGTLCCLCCTSTLAAGVNLPARRVIIRSPYTGKEFLTRSRYKQMVGRAGRAGLDTSGESFLILQPLDLLKAKSLFLSPLEVCQSTLADNEDRGLTSLLFSSMGLGVSISLPELKRLVGCSLLALQASARNIDVHTKIMEIVEHLRKQGLVCIKPEGDFLSSASSSANKNESRMQYKSSGTSSKNESTPQLSKSLENSAQLARPVTDDDTLVVSRFGRAAIKGSIDLSLASRLYKDLCLARENLALNSHLHLLYLVIPYEVVSSVSILPDVFYNAYMSLGEEEMKVAKLLGITDGVIVKLSMGHKSKKVDQNVLHRFYVALLLHRIWSGMGIWQASDLFRVHRGFTQNALSSSAAFASCVFHFCQELEELWAFRDLLANFARQISGCCSAELLPLLDLPAVKQGRARMLYNAGYHTLQDVANSEPRDLVNSVEHLPHRIAVQIINSAKMLLIERAETLQGEAEEVLLGLRHHLPQSQMSTKLAPSSSPDANPDSKASPSTTRNAPTSTKSATGAVT
ncbi:helicase POLQ-like [Procambarus clarkii]|uniref:helicase POLQ-like n=1 Tax=Procambarus clarkii TaxID=6728 RepID=UPI003743985A